MYSQLFLRRTPLGPALAVRLVESQIEGAKKGRGPTLGVRFTEVSVKRESTVSFIDVVFPTYRF